VRKNGTQRESGEREKESHRRLPHIGPCSQAIIIRRAVIALKVIYQISLSAFFPFPVKKGFSKYKTRRVFLSFFFSITNSDLKGISLKMVN